MQNLPVSQFRLHGLREEAHLYRPDQLIRLLLHGLLVHHGLREEARLYRPDQLIRLLPHGQSLPLMPNHHPYLKILFLLHGLRLNILVDH